MSNSKTPPPPPQPIDPARQREGLETSKQRSITVREWGYTALIWCGVVGAGVLIVTMGILSFTLVYYMQPMAQSLKEANDKLVTEIPALREEISARGKQVETILATVSTELPKLSTEVQGAVKAGNIAVAGVGREMQGLLKGTGDELANTLRSTSASLNGDAGLFAAVTEMTRKGTDNLTNVERITNELEKQGILTGKEIRAITNSPEWVQARGRMLNMVTSADQALGKVDKTAGNVELGTAQIAEALKRAPEIADTLKKISETSSRYQKAGLMAKIFYYVIAGVAAF